MTLRYFIFAISIVLAGSAAAQAEGDPVAGAKVFNKCRACHDATGDKNKTGPNLSGVVGRKAGTFETFTRYSKGMKAAAEAGLVWDEAKLAEYLRAPKSVVPQGNMAFAGLKSDQELADIIAYLKADPKP